MTPDLHPWAADLSDLYAQVWARLVRGVRDRRAQTCHITLATVTPHGKPQARTVVLRAADKGTGTLDIHTDLHLAKVGGCAVLPLPRCMCGTRPRACRCGWRPRPPS